MVHLFDYPYEEDVVPIETLFKTYGKVKEICLILLLRGPLPPLTGFN